MNDTHSVHHVKGMFEGSSSGLKGLEDKGKQYLAEISAMAKSTVKRFGKVVPELVDKLKGTELIRQTEVLRVGLLDLLKVPRVDQVERIEAAIEKLNRDIAGLKLLKGDVKNLSDQIKAVHAR